MIKRYSQNDNQIMNISPLDNIHLVIILSSENNDMIFRWLSYDHHKIADDIAIFIRWPTYNNQKVVNYQIITYDRQIFNTYICQIISRWSSHDLQKKSSDDHLMIIWWSYDDHMMIHWRSSGDNLMIILLSTDDHLMIIRWSSDNHMIINNLSINVLKLINRISSYITSLFFQRLSDDQQTVIRKSYHYQHMIKRYSQYDNQMINRSSSDNLQIIRKYHQKIIIWYSDDYNMIIRNSFEDNQNLICRSSYDHLIIIILSSVKYHMIISKHKKISLTFWWFVDHQQISIKNLQNILIWTSDSLQEVIRWSSHNHKTKRIIKSSNDNQMINW